MAKIFLGIPSIRNDQAFRESMDKFIPQIVENHQVEAVEVRNRPIDVARNMIVDFFIEKDFDYLLFLDDDHSGHTSEMLEALLKPNEYVCAMKCYTKDFPYFCTLQDYSEADSEYGRYQEKNLNNGYAYCDLVGFGMTLIRKDTFEKLKKPYFASIGNCKEDNYFCDNLHFSGIKTMGCFDYVLTHAGVNDSTIEQKKIAHVNKLQADIKAKYPDMELEDVFVIS